MQFQDVVRDAPTVRYYLQEPVEPRVLHRILDAARYAPSGGNRQGWHVILVQDPAQRRRLADLYREPWFEYSAELKKRASDPAGPGAKLRAVSAADHFAAHLHAVPVLLVVTIELDLIAFTDAGLSRPSIVGGASVYTFVQNILLAARDEGLGGALTTMLCRVEDRAKDLLNIPEGQAIACMVALGWPDPDRRPRMRRRPVEEFCSLDSFGQPFVVDTA